MKEQKDEGLIEVLMACQSVTTIDHGNDDIQLVGDPLEVEMLKFSGARVVSRPIEGAILSPRTAGDEHWWNHDHVPAFTDALVLPDASLRDQAPTGKIAQPPKPPSPPIMMCSLVMAIIVLSHLLSSSFIIVMDRRVAHPCHIEEIRLQF